MIVYEFPLNERVRTLLRLEHLWDRLLVQLDRELAVDHHGAMLTVFEIIDVCTRGADLKTELLKDLERQRTVLAAYRGNPAISDQALDKVLGDLEQAFQALVAIPGKAGQSILENEWLMSIRGRANIPGGTFEFDLPSYHAWQHLPSQRRQGDLKRWVAPMQPLFAAVRLLLALQRDSGVMQTVQAPAGLFQQSFGNRAFQLVRLRVAAQPTLVPETTGSRLMVSIRFLQPDEDFHLKAHTETVTFDMALCA